MKKRHCVLTTYSPTKANDTANELESQNKLWDMKQYLFDGKIKVFEVTE